MHCKGRIDFGFIAFERIKTYMDVEPEHGYNNLHETENNYLSNNKDLNEISKKESKE